MITLVNFSNKKFRSKQRWSTFCGKYFGKFDNVFEYQSTDIDKETALLNKESLKFAEKGLGNYFWKPYIIEKALNRISEGDFLVYADSGSFFIKSVLPLISCMENEGKNIMCFQLPLIEKQWTKRDAFILMNSDNKKYTDSPQILATYFILRKCKESLDFVSEYKKYCSDYRVLSDSPNELGENNYSEFIEHRHDQSVLSLLCKKDNNVLLKQDMSDFGYYPNAYIKNSDRLYSKEMLNVNTNQFKGTIISNRTQNQVVYLFKYFVKRILLYTRIKV